MVILKNILMLCIFCIAFKENYGWKIHKQISSETSIFSNDEPQLHSTKTYNAYPKVNIGNGRLQTAHLFKTNSYVSELPPSENKKSSSKSDVKTLQTQIGEHLIKVTSKKEHKSSGSVPEGIEHENLINPKYSHIIEIIRRGSNPEKQNKPTRTDDSIELTKTVDSENENSQENVDINSEDFGEMVKEDQEEFGEVVNEDTEKFEADEGETEESVENRDTEEFGEVNDTEEFEAGEGETEELVEDGDTEEFEDDDTEELVESDEVNLQEIIDDKTGSEKFNEDSNEDTEEFEDESETDEFVEDDGETDEFVEDDGETDEFVEDDGETDEFVEDDGETDEFVEDDGETDEFVEDDGETEEFVEDDGETEEFVEDDGETEEFVEDDGETEEFVEDDGETEEFVEDDGETEEFVEDDGETEEFVEDDGETDDYDDGDSEELEDEITKQKDETEGDSDENNLVESNQAGKDSEELTPENTEDTRVIDETSTKNNGTNNKPVSINKEESALTEEFEGSGEEFIDINDRNSTKTGRILGIFSRRNETFPICTTPKGEAGHCRRLGECLLSEALNNFNGFLQQLCLIRGALVGICCPDNPVIETVNPDENVTSELMAEEIKQPPEGCGLNTKTRIVGGTISVPHEWTWMVALMRRNRFYCGGVIINNWYVLTAAHCVMGMNVKDLTVRLGEYDFNEQSKHTEDLSVSEIKRHAQFVTITFQHDIALLKLKRSIKYSKFVGSICLPDEKARDYSDVKGTVVGWGTVSFGGAASPVLRQVTVPVWRNEDCDRTYLLESIGDSFMCAGAPEKGEDACQGDSGGPLMTVNENGRWEVIGLVSWGRRCGDPTYPGVYTRVTTYLDWIKQNAV